MPKGIKIIFLLPSVSFVPGGGFKIVYEYAYRLFEKGYRVNVVHPFYLDKKDFFVNKYTNYYRYLKLLRKKSYFTGKWFSAGKMCHKSLIPYIEDKFIGYADAIVATGWQTAKPVIKLNQSKGRKFYFIQSLETWSGPEEEVLRTWKLPLKKIVISKWLHEFAVSINEEAEYIPNGLDFLKFGLDVLPENRNPNTILMMVNSNKVKGSEFGLLALLKLKEILPDIEVTTFGVDNFGVSLPHWIKHFKNPAQEYLRLLYNSHSIFLSPSFMEGFPLPPAEAMMCGCALVASDIGGHREYAVNSKNSLLFPPGDIQKSVECLLKVIKDQVLRCSIAMSGYNDIKKYTWDKSIQRFDQFICENIKK